MAKTEEVLAAEQRFFDALLEADPVALEKVLTDDFLIVDVMMGSVVPKVALVGAVAEGHIAFRSIDRLEAEARFYGEVAIVVGRTQMAGDFGGTPFSANSRYTHVFVKQSTWRLASAQGTQIVDTES